MNESTSYIRKKIKTHAKMIFFGNLFQITSILFLYYLIKVPSEYIASGIAEYIASAFPIFSENLYFSYILTYYISSLIAIIGAPLLYGIIFNINKVELIEPTTYSNYFIWFSKGKYTLKALLVRLNYIIRSIPYFLVAFSPVILGMAYIFISENPDPHIKNLLTGDYFMEFMNQFSSVMQKYLTDPTNFMNEFYNISPVLLRNVLYQMVLLSLCSLVNSILLLRFFLVDYIIVKNPDMKISSVFALSKKAMKGHYVEYILFLLSFIPAILLSSVFCNFLIVFIYIYIFVATILFANRLIKVYYREV